MYAPLDRFKLLGSSLLALLLAVTTGCADDSDQTPIVNDEDALGSGADFVRNPSSFVSAEGAAGEQTSNRGDGSLDSGAPSEDAGAGARPEHLVRLTWYVTDKAEYLSSLKELGRAYRAVIGRHYPAMALVQVVALVEDRAKVEIEATAVVPE